MSLVERIRKGKELITQGRSYGKDTNHLEAEVQNLQHRLEVEVTRLKLSEFENCNIAVEIYSEVFGYNIWLCSDEEMKHQIIRDNPNAITYTKSELKELIMHNTNRESLMKINDIKSIFPLSTLKE